MPFLLQPWPKTQYNTVSKSTQRRAKANSVCVCEVVSVAPPLLKTPHTFRHQPRASSQNMDSVCLRRTQTSQGHKGYNIIPACYLIICTCTYGFNISHSKYRTDYRLPMYISCYIYKYRYIYMCTIMSLINLIKHLNYTLFYRPVCSTYIQPGYNIN